jgi:hypothetical protein
LITSYSKYCVFARFSAPHPSRWIAAAGGVGTGTRIDEARIGPLHQEAHRGTIVILNLACSTQRTHCADDEASITRARRVIALLHHSATNICREAFRLDGWLGWTRLARTVLAIDRISGSSSRRRATAG